MAGNIIHAIATTNAIIAGFIVIEGLKILGKAEDSCRVSSRTCISTCLGPMPGKSQKLQLSWHTQSAASTLVQEQNQTA